jgi:hypothetical protein
MIVSAVVALEKVVLEKVSIIKVEKIRSGTEVGNKIVAIERFYFKENEV